MGKTNRDNSKKKNTKNEQNKFELSRSGEHICLVCGAKIPENSSVCVICHTPVGQQASAQTLQPITEDSAQVGATISPQTLHQDRSRLRRLFSFLVIVFLISGLAAFVIEYAAYSVLVSQYTTQNALLYQQSNNSLKIKLSTKTDPITITNRYQSVGKSISAKESRDQRVLAYLNSQRTWENGYSGELYLLNMLYLAPNYSDQGSIKVTSNRVVDFAFSPSNNLLIYLTTDDELFVCDYKSLLSPLTTSRISITKLDSNVTGIGAVLQNTVLYYKGSSSNVSSFEYNKTATDGSPFDLYSISLSNSSAKPSMIDSDVYSVLDMTNDLSHILYTKRIGSGSKSLFSVYYFDGTETPSEPMLQDVARVVSADALTQKVVYLTPNTQTLTFADLYEDDMKESDSTLTDPNSAEAQVDSDLTSSQSQSAVSDAEESAVTLTEENQMELQSNYAEKIVRDYFRNFVNSQLSTYQQSNFVSFQLQYYDPAQEGVTVLSDKILNWDSSTNDIKGSLKDNYFLYVTSGASGSTRKISSLDTDSMNAMMLETLPVQSELRNTLAETLFFVSTNTWQPLSLFTEPGPKSIGQYSFSKDNKIVYFIVRNADHDPVGTLYSVSENETTSDKVVYIDDGVNGYVGVAGAPIAGLFYQSSSLDENPVYSYYWYGGDGVWQIDTQTANYKTAKIIGKDPALFVYFKEWNESTTSGTLYGFSGEDAFLISQGISEVIYSSGSDIYLLGSENAGGTYRNLAVYKNGEVTLIDTTINDYLNLSSAKQ